MPLSESQITRSYQVHNGWNYQTNLKRGSLGLNALLSFGDESGWFVAPVEICETMDPPPLLKIRYLAPVRAVERRAAERIRSFARGVIRVSDQRGVHDLSCVTRDISPGGVRLVVSEALFVGQLVRVATEASRAGDRPRHEVAVRREASSSEEEAARWMSICAAERWAGGAGS